MVALHPCPGCKRHVRDDASACPFCDGPLEPREARTDRRVPIRLGRAARMAFGAAVAGSMTVAVACSGGSGPTPTSDGGGEEEDAKNSDGTVIVEADSSTDTNPPPPPDDAIAKPYGAPPADGLRRVV